MLLATSPLITKMKYWQTGGNEFDELLPCDGLNQSACGADVHSFRDDVVFSDVSSRWSNTAAAIA